MVDYSKETVAKLQEILKSRQLPTSGKKADLIQRLKEADEVAETNGTCPLALDLTSHPNKFQKPKPLLLRPLLLPPLHNRLPRRSTRSLLQSPPRLSNRLMRP